MAIRTTTIVIMITMTIITITITINNKNNNSDNKMITVIFVINHNNTQPLYLSNYKAHKNCIVEVGGAAGSARAPYCPSK